MTCCGREINRGRDADCAGMGDAPILADAVKEARLSRVPHSPGANASVWSHIIEEAPKVLNRGAAPVPISERTAHGCGQRQHDARNSIRTRGSFKATEASLTIAADQADAMPVSPSSPCSGIHNRLHGPLHCLVVDWMSASSYAIACKNCERSPGRSRGAAPRDTAAGFFMRPV